MKNCQKYENDINVFDKQLIGYINDNDEKIILIRVGLESVSEKTRFELGKRITDEMVKTFLDKTLIIFIKN